MKERLTRNLSLKILSLLLAVILWIVILNIDDPVDTETFTKIPVTRINESALESEDKVYDVISGETVDVTVKAKRSIIEELEVSNFRAIADLSELSIVNAVPIEVSIPGFTDEVEIIDQNDLTMKVSIENLVQEQFRIEIVEKGSVAEGHYIKEATARPNMLQVSGAESVISKIQKVVAEVNVNQEAESFMQSVEPKVYDKNGSLMDSSKITFNYEEIDVSVSLLNTKEVNLFVEVEGTPFYGYEYVGIEYEPKQVEIAGEQSELNKVKYIIAVYNISNKNTDIEDEIDIQDFITEDVILIDNNQNAVINIDIERMNQQDLEEFQDQQDLNY
jgi:YbbR domain-containing protein